MALATFACWPAGSGGGASDVPGGSRAVEVTFVGPADAILDDLPSVRPELPQEISSLDLPVAAPPVLIPDAETVACTSDVPSTITLPAGADIRIAVEIPGTGGETPFLVAVREAVARQIRYPASARMRGIEGQVTVNLTIDGVGALVAVRAIPSEADNVLVQAAVDAATRAAPFPAPLMACDEQTVTAQLPVRFKLVE